MYKRNNTSNESVIFDWGDNHDFYDMVKSCENNPSTPYILKYFPKNCFILEAGCGPGHFVKYLCEKGYKVIGVEINKEVVLQCNLLEPDIDVRLCS